MAGRDGLMGKAKAIQLDRLLVERVNRYEPDWQIEARKFLPQITRPKGLANGVVN